MIMCADHHCNIDLCGCDADVQYRAAQAERIFAKIDRERSERAARWPSEADCLRIMFDAYQRLKELGWNDAIYCPKDGTVFDSISAGSTGIHPCHYEGDWPGGSWWVHEAHDLWPASPILYRARPAEISASGPERSEGAGSAPDEPILPSKHTTGLDTEPSAAGGEG